MLRVLCILLVLIPVACGQSAATIADRLNGTWSSGPVRYEFNFTNGTMTRTVLGKAETKPMTLVSQDANSITIRTDGDPITITLIDDNTATIAQSGKIPLQVKRQ